MATSDEKKLALAFGRLAPIGRKALEAIASIAVRRSFVQDSFLLRAGETAKWCHLLDTGLVRELYIGTKGDEHTRSFIREGEVTGSLVDLLSGGPSLTWIQALELTTTLTFSYAAFDALSEGFPELNVLSRRHAEALYIKKTRREHEMLALTANERYARWSAAENDLDSRVSRRHLASYLGITPEHLSRLRARLKSPIVPRRSKPLK